MSKREPCGAIDDVTGKVAFWEGLYCEQVRESVDHMKATLHRGRDELRQAARRTSEMVALIHNASDELERALSVVRAPADKINEIVEGMKLRFDAVATEKSAEFAAQLDAAIKTAAARILSHAIGSVAVKPQKHETNHKKRARQTLTAHTAAQ